MSDQPPASAPPPPNPDLDRRIVALFTREFAARPQPVYDALLQHCPVAHNAFLGTPVLSRYEDVSWALRHPELFSSKMDMHVALGTERPMIPQQIDPPEQTRYRKILDPRFSRKRMAEIAPAVRRHANELIDAFIERGECELDREFAVPLPCTAFLQLMGLPQSDLPLFLRLKDGIIRPQTQLDAPSPEASAEHRKKTGREIYAYFEQALDERARAPGDDMLSYLLGAELDGRKLSRNDILDVSFLLILAGLDTVTATIGCSIAYLAGNPDQREQLVSDPTRIPAAVEELLRWETPVTAVPRVLAQDVELHGEKLEKGSLVTLLIGASNLDGAEFSEAGCVHLERERNRHLAFGAGPHRCLGSHLARLELQVALEEWHRRIPVYRLKPGEAPRYSPGIREVEYLPLVWERGA